jgi:iron complex transport system substrate-binding protein
VFIIPLLFAVLLLLPVGCSSQNGSGKIDDKAQEKAMQTGKERALFPVTVTDDAGRKITVEKEPKRIVSIAPSNTEILYALACQDRLIGVTDYCDYPKEAKKKEKIGSFSSPNLEKILSLEPDIVFVNEGVQASFREQLEKAKINVFVVSPKTVEGMIDVLVRIGKAVGSENKADEVSNRLKERLAQVERRLSNLKERKTAFYELYHEPLMTVGAKSAINNILSKAGVINIAGDIQDNYPQYSLETLVQKDPGVYLASTGSMQSPGDLSKRVGWTKLSAIRNNQVFTLNEDIINRPGPRMVDAVERIASAVYPELFKKN